MKLSIALLWTAFIVLIVCAICIPYDSKTYTGQKIGPLDLKNNEILVVQAETYHLKATSCNPFSFTDSAGRVYNPSPENIENSGCDTSYFVMDSDLNINHMVVKNGSPIITLTTETPTALNTSFDPDTVTNVWALTVFIAFWVWALIGAAILVS